MNGMRKKDEDNDDDDDNNNSNNKSGLDCNNNKSEYGTHHSPGTDTASLYPPPGSLPETRALLAHSRTPRAPRHCRVRRQEPKSIIYNIIIIKYNIDHSLIIFARIAPKGLVRDSSDRSHH